MAAKSSSSKIEFVISMFVTSNNILTWKFNESSVIWEPKIATAKYCVVELRNNNAIPVTNLSQK